MSPQLAGIAFGLAAYGIWGFFPLFFRQLADVAPMDILTHRAVWACIFVSLLLLARGQGKQMLKLFQSTRHLAMLTLAGLLVGSNWLVFLWAVESRQVVASSLGYFLTPLVNVLLGLLVLKEKVSRLEWLAIGLAALGLLNEIIALGQLPWISLILALTFGTYGLVRKQVPVDALSGLWLETLSMLPLCLLYAFWQNTHGHTVFTGYAPTTAALLVAAGILTAVPLMAFAAATRRLDLVTVGMLMYINPTLQFLTAVLLFGEAMNPARLASFGLIWLGLAVFSISLWHKYRR